MPISISNIINSSRSADEAYRAFNLNYPNPTTNQGSDIMNGVNRKFPLNGNNNNNNNNNGTGVNGNTSSNDEGILSKLGSRINSVIKGTANISNDLYKSQMGQSSNVGVPDVIGDTLTNLGDKGISGKFLFDELAMGAKIFTNILEQESKLQSEINSKTTITGQLSKDLRNDIQESADYAAKYGMSMNDLGEMYSKLVQTSGKFSLINRETLLLAIPAVKAFGSTMEGMADTISEFEKVGIGANNTIKTISDAGVRSVQLGLSGKKVTEEIQRNIEKLNQYGFQNGVKGLEVMVRKSLEFKMNLDEVFKISEKVMNPEGALEMTANLQMLGGAIGDFNNPIKMMYDATNNAEGLQDALHGAAQSLTSYNSEQGRFEITGMNLRRASEMAKVLGVDYKELTKSAIAGAERLSATTSLAASGLKMSDKDKEFLINMSRMEGGQMVIKVPESISEKLGGVTELALDNLHEDQAKVLAKYQSDLANMNVKEIAMGQLTTLQQIEHLLTSKMVKGGVTVAGGMKGVLEGLGGEKINNVKKSLDNDVENTRYRKKENTEEVYKEGTIKIKNEISNFIDGLKEKIGMKVDKPEPQLTKEDITQSVYEGVYKSMMQTWNVNINNFPQQNIFSTPQTPAQYVSH